MLWNLVVPGWLMLGLVQGVDQFLAAKWGAVLPGVVLLGVVIFVHELGHFLAAKWRKVRVLKFSLGFGPALVKVKRGETEYCISWIPLGGYVQMAGDAPGTDGTMPGGPDEFLSHPWYGRMIIALAGPAANLVTAFLVMVSVGLVGVSYPDYPNQVGATPDTSVAYRLGVREGDRIVAVGKAPVRSWVEIFALNSRIQKKQPVDVRMARGDRTLEIHLAAAEREPFFSSLRRPPDPPIVGSVVTGMPAYKAGLKEGDRILSVNGKPISTWGDLPLALRGMVDRPVRLMVQRNGHSFEVTLKPINPEGDRGGNGMIGIGAPRHGAYVERYGFAASFSTGARSTLSMVPAVYHQMWLILSRFFYYREYVGGPIFIAQIASEQARQSLDAYLQTIAWINVAIMAFNLLPLPVLDGGHVLLAVIEGLRRQRLSARGYLRFQKIGLVMMATLFMLIVANDSMRLVQRQRALDRPTSAPQERPVAPP